MKKLWIILLFVSAYQIQAKKDPNHKKETSEYPNTVPVVGAVVAAVEAPPDILAGLVGTSIHESEKNKRVPVVGVFTSTVENAANIVTSFFGVRLFNKDKKGTTETIVITETNASTEEKEEKSWIN